MVKPLSMSKPQPDEVTRTVWEEASAIGQAIQLQKFAASTYPPDVKAPEMPEEMKMVIDSKTIGKIWRARVGRANRWWYGWHPEEALAKALAAPRK